jgi:hypothetical protein
MQLFSGLVAVGLVAALAVGGPAARAAEGGKKKAAHTVRGTVVKVTPGQGGAPDTFTIQVAAKKANGKGKAKGAAGGERTFQVTKATEFVTMGKKKAATPATFTQLKPGAQVVVTADAGAAKKVQIASHGKKAKQQGGAPE